MNRINKKSKVFYHMEAVEAFLALNFLKVACDEVPFLQNLLNDLILQSYVKRICQNIFQNVY